jgi:hypothetical protein
MKSFTLYLQADETAPIIKRPGALKTSGMALGQARFTRVMTVASKEDMEEAGRWALSSAELKAGHRAKSNFIRADNLAFDFEGPDVDGVKQTVPGEEIHRIMEGIAFCAVTSLSGGWHVFCPLQTVITDLNRGQALKAAWIEALGADGGAKDLVRTYYGTPPEALKAVEGEGELIDTLDRVNLNTAVQTVTCGDTAPRQTDGFWFGTGHRLTGEELKRALAKGYGANDTYVWGIPKDYSAFLRGEQPAGTRFANIPGAVAVMRNRGYTWERVEDVIRLNWANDPAEKVDNALQWDGNCYAGKEIRRTA